LKLHDYVFGQACSSPMYKKNIRKKKKKFEPKEIKDDAMQWLLRSFAKTGKQ